MRITQQPTRKADNELLMCGHYQQQHPTMSPTACLEKDYQEVYGDSLFDSDPDWSELDG